VEADTYNFESFRDDIEDRVRRLNARLKKPDATWPGVLFLDVPGGLEAEAFDVAGISEVEKHALASQTLPAFLIARHARRFCWAMPAWRTLSDDRRQECLILIFGERGRCEVAVAVVFRNADLPPRLGPWERAPFGAGTRSASGLFVDPLLEAISSAPRWRYRSSVRRIYG